MARIEWTELTEAEFRALPNDRLRDEYVEWYLREHCGEKASDILTRSHILKDERKDKEKARLFTEELLSLSFHRYPDVDAMISRDWEIAEMSARLTPEQRLARSMESRGYRQRQIAEALGIKQPAVSRLLQRADDKVTEEFIAGSYWWLVFFLECKGSK